MKTWNYRVCKHTYNQGQAHQEVSYYIGGVYYNGKGEICAVSETPAGVCGEYQEDLTDILEKMSTAMTKDIVDLDTIVYASSDE